MFIDVLCNLVPKDWLNIVLAIIGILVSGGGLFIAIHQICRVRKTSEAVQEEVKESQKKIRRTLDSNEIGRAVKNLEQSIDYIKNEEYNRALTRMIDVKSIIENDTIVKQFLPEDFQLSYSINKRRFHDSVKTIMTDINHTDNIDKRMVLNSLIDIYDSLIKVENAIKDSVYERTN